MILLTWETWETWPPEGHKQRIEKYALFRLLFMGKHDDVYARMQQWLEKEADKAVIYIVCNFAGLISKICADLLFGEPIRAVLGDEDSPEQKAMDNIFNNNNLHTVNYEMALSSSYRGDAVYKARFGKYRDWSEGEQAIIESVPAHVFFPHLNGDNVQEMTGATLAWTKEVNDRKYLRKEIHLPGLIRNELWLLDGSQIRMKVPLKTLDEYDGLKDEQETKYPGLLVEHVPNWRLDDMFWGISDYEDLESLFDGLNNRVSRVDRILDKHSDPKLILPPGLMKYDEKRKMWYIEKELLQVVEVDQTMVGDLPKYLVWDAQLEAAFKEIDKFLELLMIMSEISPAAFGLDKSGVAESGRALKFRLIRTLAKINRKKLYFDQGLKNILYAAQVLDVTFGKSNYEPAIPRIVWADGLPVDQMEQAEIEASRLAAENTSLESSVRRLDGLEGKALQEEIDRIRKAAKERTPPAPNITLPKSGEQGAEGGGGGEGGGG
ncbi:MAG: phage portal protein [Ammonifex sp.]|nr:MAG: phage portal protein [Ammonifex sp.]